jgi:hypothetical protein
MSSPAIANLGRDRRLLAIVKGRAFPYRTVAQCALCSYPAPAKDTIETLVVAGATYRQARQQAGTGLSTRSIRRHFQRGHHPLIAVLRRELMARAEERIVRNIRDSCWPPHGSGQPSNHPPSR